MEIVGLAVGVAGLAGLFGACMGAMEHLHSYKTAGHESRYIIAAFDANKLLFQRWADGVGIAENMLEDLHHPALDDAAVALVVGKILSSIRNIFKMTDSISSKLLLKSIDSEMFSLKKMPGFPQGNLIDMKNTHSLDSRKSRISWALGGKTNLTTQVEVFGLLVEKLYGIIPIEEGGKFSTGETQKELYGWLDAITTHENFESYLSTHLSGTCDWIFSNPTFCTWVSPEFDDDLAKFLWVYGPAGHGKSVLCARMIKFLKNASEAPVAYFFCSSDDKTQREPLAIIRSWIWQAINCHENALDQALERFRAKEMRLASRTDVWKLFGSIVHMIPNSTFVVDGLDECLRSSNDWRSSGNSSRIEFLISLKASVARTRTRILIVSRDEGDIRSEMSLHNANTIGPRLYECRLSKEVLNPDITLFSKSVVNRKLANKDGTFREALAAQMAEKCDGMFLLIRLQENQLSRSKNRKQLQAIVSNMPGELEHAYERDWEYISGLPKYEKLRALDILRWVTFALRPLTVLEITEALLIEDNDNCADLRSDELPDDVDKDFVDEQIIGLCGSLLEIRSSGVEKMQSPGSNTIHLAHFSVKEYLLAMIPDKSVLFSNRNSQNASLAKLCLRYLNYPTVWISNSPHGSNHSHHSFLDYAVTSWHKHAVMDNESNQELVDLTNKFFTLGNPDWDRWRKHFESSTEAVLSDFQHAGEESPPSNIEQSEKEPSLSDIERPGEEPSLSDIEEGKKRPGTLLYYAALFGLVDTVKFLQDQKDFNLNEVGGKYGTALQAACAHGHLSIVRCLVDYGADIDIQGGEYTGCALSRAAYKGHLEILNLLLDRGADTAIVDEHGDTPLMNAIYDGYIEVARTLLDRGANHAIANRTGLSPLGLAAYKGHLEIVKILLDKGADTAVVDEDGNTPLMNSIYEGHIEVARTLLKRGANLAIANKTGWSPLGLAANKGHLEIAYLLLDKGADTAVVNENGNIPPMNAIYNGNIEVARTLLDRGANHATANRTGLCPLSHAAFKGHLEIVNLLLDRGADTAAVDEDGNTPLIHAIYEGHMEVARTLLDRGANHAIANKTGWSPLGHAARKGHLEIVTLLLNRGADTVVVNEHGNTPLMNAVYYGHIEVTRTLLERGANHAIANKSGLRPLSRAAYKGHLEIVNLLLDRGADTAAVDEFGNTPLMNAIYEGHMEVTRTLLNRGANLAIANKKGLSPLGHAAREGHLEIVKLLLDRGADTAVVNEDGATPLINAIFEGHVEVARLLLEKGANLAVADNNGSTPLEIAAQNCRLEIAKLLLERGADPNITDKHGNPPIHTAAQYGYPKMVTLLLKNGADQTIVDQDGDSSLMCAIVGGNLEVIRLLLDRGASLDISNNAGLSPLCLAATEGHLEVTKFLLERGLDATLSSEHLDKVLGYATAGGHLEVVELLNIHSKSRLE
ncbi:hypothetical protein MMC31_004970 [Peltigera leucophlebia]|nr:hypothetical protein [Peltigera leucophlebia]